MSRPALSTLTAALVSVIQLMTIALLYILTDWYIDHAELSALDALPPDAKRAWVSINNGEIPAPSDLAALAPLYPTLEEATEASPVEGVLGFGFLLIVFTSGIGVVLAYRLVAPLTRLTAAAEKIRQGDFQVTVEPGATKEVETLAITINRMASELLALETRLKFNTRAVAHELRTPLTVLQGNLQGMTDGVIPASEDQLRALLAQTRGMSRLVDQLNTLSLAGTIDFVTATTATDLALHASETVTLFQISAGGDVNFRTYLAPAPAMIDPDRFRQAILALLENARRYAGDFGPIDVHTGVDDTGRSFISVQDKGPGLPDYAQHSSFDMFWRSERLSGRGTSGSGLGLTIVKAIAEGHNARLEVGNNPDGGAYAKVTFEVA
ncbi:MAG: HAMP domain-containing histidine kinase [Rhizobiaceae bacterium]|nr:MAG: HAMP domain-containing histidine kinase [Rhizobiaceae bacterium]